MDPYVGEIRILPYGYVPRGWLLCDGSSYSTRSFRSLFTLIGYAYGGAGPSFSVPRLNGRLPLGAGQGPGLSDYTVGQHGGAASVTLSSDALASHNHALAASTRSATQTVPWNNEFGVGGQGTGPQAAPIYWYSSQTPTVALFPNTITSAGDGREHNNLMPYLALQFCINWDGPMPSSATSPAG